MKGAIATLTPRPDADACEGDGCTEGDDLACVDPDDPAYEERTLCGRHRVAYFEEISS